MIHDEISNPKHYDLFPDGMQAIDVIRAALTPEEFAGYCKGNFLKYRLRAGEKGPVEKCIGKAEWYRDRLHGYHDFMNSEAITRVDHAKLKVEDEAKAAAIRAAMRAQEASEGMPQPVSAANKLAVGEKSGIPNYPREAVGAAVAFHEERGLYFAATPGEMEDGA